MNPSSSSPYNDTIKQLIVRMGLHMAMTIPIIIGVFDLVRSVEGKTVD